MPKRRVVYAVALAVLLAAWRGPSPTFAALVDRASGLTPGAIPQFDGAQAVPLVPPGPSVLRGAGLPSGDLTEALAGTRVPTATPVPTEAAPSLLAVDSPETAPSALSQDGSREASPPPSGGTEHVLTPTPSTSTGDQVVVFYGVPGNPDLGVLGTYSAAAAATAVRDKAAEYDVMNGDGGVRGMLDLVYAQAQSEPTDNGLYLRYLSDAVVRRYISAAKRQNVQIMLDLQIGRGDPLLEVQKIDRYLRDPLVHVAIDPEYAVGADGVPLETPGVIMGDQINAVEEYVSGLVSKYRLPSKMVVIHQYMPDTVQGGEQIRSSAGVDLVFNMDALGAVDEKVMKYSAFAARGYPAHQGFNVFLQHDDRVMSDEEVLRLSPRPEVIFYQ